jgi:hypothetical protein
MAVVALVEVFVEDAEVPGFRRLFIQKEISGQNHGNQDPYSINNFHGSHLRP